MMESWPAAVSVKVLETVCGSVEASAAWMVIVKVPVVSGVPAMMPLEESVRPVGRAPLMTAHV